MSDNVVARRYAQALIELAAEAGEIERVGQDLAHFASVMDANGRMLGSALCSPVFTLDERRAVLDQLLPRIRYSTTATNALRLINDKRRLPMLGDIVEAYEAMADERAGRARVTVQTAEPLGPQLEAEVRAALEAVTGKQVVLRAEVRPELIGGLVARVGDKVYDSSLRTRLDQIKQSLLRSTLPGQA